MKLCRECGVNKRTSRGHGQLKHVCSSCNRKPYAQFKKSTCEDCGFIPAHMNQLDIDHVDGNHKNNDPVNLRTLCANCHRLKTVLHRDFQNVT